MKTVFPYSIIILLLLSCCGKSDNRLRLESINAIAETDGRQALAMLDSVKDLDYSKKERAYFNLLTIKSRDKAYIDHQNDSLIKEVLEYYEKNEGEDYAEALYYGGRVYSDLGNYPTSLEYFHRALDELPDDDGDHRLIGHVVSQLGRLLIELRLYNQAIPYLEKSIEYDELDRDSFNLAFDYDLIKTAYLGEKNYEIAEEFVRKACEVGCNLPKENKIYFKSGLAEVKMHRGENDSALMFIRKIIDRISTDNEPYIWADASQIYYKNGIYDTAYIYAKKIVQDERLPNKRIGYYMLMRPEIKTRIPVDTLIFYYDNFAKYIEDYLNCHDSQQALMQTSMYNYELHERESKEAKSSRDRILKILVCLLIITLVFVILTLYFKLRVRTRDIELNKAKQRIDDLLTELEILTKSDDIEKEESTEVSIQEKRNELLFIANQNFIIDSIANKITEVYDILLSKIENGGIIDSELWMKIETQVNLKSSNFIKNLQILAGGSLNETEIKTCYLIKVGLSPTQLSKVLNITKGAVSSRRECIGMKVLGEKISVTIVDRVIRLL
ncbi:MAG: tetratricopeptide repeat protein [Bacteroides sp.]|nr:tetratricopeptide repeat protein [Bacteroides sp.]